ncbi:MAG: tetratricopeptide repeat protein [Endomicrobiales bacterium]
MKKLMVPILIFLMAAMTVCAATGEENIREALRLCESRHIHPENVGTSETLLLDAVNDEPHNARAWYELSRIYFYLGDLACEKKEKIADYNKGIECGKKAVACDNGAEWGYIWQAANMGRLGQVKGVLKSLKLISPIRSLVEKALEINPNSTAALDIRAVVNYETPKLFGGDVQRSIEDLKTAISINPRHTLLYVDLAEAYLRDKQYDKAREALTAMFAIAQPAYMPDYVLTDKPRAEALMKKLDESKH